MFRIPMKTGNPHYSKQQIANSKGGSKFLLLAVCYLLFAIPLVAADFQVNASLDKSQIALNEQAVLSLTVSGSETNLPQPQLPGLSDFQIYNAGKAQNFSWINGQASASVTYSYVLTPLHEGHFTIPPIRLEFQNQTAQTSPLTLDVVKGEAAAIPAAPSSPSAASGAGGVRQGRSGQPALFITGTVDKSSVYVGEPVTYSFRLYNRVQLLSRPSYQPPETQGFWSEDLPPQRTYTAQVRGVPYNVTEVRTALFPSTEGKATIGSATLSVSIENFGSDPFGGDFFAQFFGQGEQKDLRTDPITIRVKPLPLPQPDGFKGAVGQYTLSAAMDKDNASVGQPLTLTVTVAGRGNIKSLPDMTMPPLTNFRTFDANAATNIDKKNGQVEGSKVFKTVLIPTASGDLQVPSLSFVFFNPETRTYKTIHSRPITVHIAPAPPGAAGANAPVPVYNTNSSAPGIRLLGEDIRYIQTPPQISSQDAPLYRRRWFQGLQGLILLGVLGAGLFRLYTFFFLSNVVLSRFRAAHATAQAAARQAETALDQAQTKKSAELLSDALRAYLAAKVSMGDQEISLKSALEQLRSRGMVAHDTEKVRNLWETLDLFQFAPTQVRPEELRQVLRTFEHVIDEVEKAVPWKG